MNVSRVRVLVKEGRTGKFRRLKVGETVEPGDIMAFDTFFDTSGAGTWMSVLPGAWTVLRTSVSSLPESCTVPSLTDWRFLCPFSWDLPLAALDRFRTFDLVVMVRSPKLGP